MGEQTRRKRVLITGCSSGFGLAIAVEAAKAGYDCIATMRNLGKADYLKKTLEGVNVTAVIDQLDVTDGEAVRDIAAKYAPVDILVNNSGILIMGSCLDISDEEMRRIFETNYFGAVAMTRAVAGGMIEAGGGLIINIASLAGLVGHMYNAAYSASKHALVGFSRSIRLELKPHNIDVVCIEPGYHKTEIIRANANLCEEFYNRQSPMFEYNQGFLRLMFDEIIPRAAEPDEVVKKAVEIMGLKKPKPHYIIGKDAAVMVVARKLGLMGLLEKKFYSKLMKATKRQRRRTEQRAARKTRSS